MGRKDNAQKAYFDDKERFADMFNGALFEGETVIKSNELLEADPNIVYLENKEYRSVIADKVHNWKGTHLAVMVLENQTLVDYGMVFRAMKEESLSYDKQLRRQKVENNKQKHTKNADFISKMKKGQCLMPVVVLVVYLGTHKPWDAATCLYDVIRMDERLRPFITNYKLNLFDFHEHRDFSRFQTANRELFEVLSCAKNEEKMDEIITRNPKRYSGLDPEAADCINKIADIKLPIKWERDRNGKVVVNMCKAWDDHKESGRREGLQQGKLESIRSIMTSLKVSAQQAMEYLQIEESERETYMALL